MADASSGTDGASFLTIPTGGRPAALGGAYSALAKDAYAPIFNPGGLGFLPFSQLAAMHLSYLESVSYDVASFVHPFSSKRALGASIQYLQPGDTERRDINGNSAGNFSGSYASYALGYGQALTDVIAVGVVGKFIRAAIADDSAQTYAADAGAMFRVGSRITLAAVVANMGGQMKFVDEENSLPLSYRLGGAVSIASSLALAVQGSVSNDNDKGVQTGLEWNPIDLLSVRVGYRTETSRHLSGAAGLTAGIGLHLVGQQFDYAWVPMDDLGDAQYFSLVLQWGRIS